MTTEVLISFVPSLYQVCLSSATAYRMHMQIGNFTAWISIDNVERTQYALEYSPDGMVATCWMVSEQGKNFSDSWKDSSRTFSSTGHVLVDGQEGGGTISGKLSLRYGSAESRGNRRNRNAKELLPGYVTNNSRTHALMRSNMVREHASNHKEGNLEVGSRIGSRTLLPDGIWVAPPAASRPSHAPPLNKLRSSSDTAIKNFLFWSTLVSTFQPDFLHLPRSHSGRPLMASARLDVLNYGGKPVGKPENIVSLCLNTVCKNSIGMWKVEYWNLSSAVVAHKCNATINRLRDLICICTWESATAYLDVLITTRYSQRSITSFVVVVCDREEACEIISATTETPIRVATYTLRLYLFTFPPFIDIHSASLFTSTRIKPSTFCWRRSQSLASTIPLVPPPGCKGKFRADRRQEEAQLLVGEVERVEGRLFLQIQDGGGGAGQPSVPLATTTIGSQRRGGVLMHTGRQSCGVVLLTCGTVAHGYVSIEAGGESGCPYEYDHLKRGYLNGVCPNEEVAALTV
ncbi:hypothetical protein FPV67DRAFT_1758111 [Lyophyllum atratum]|nr:hypothetical protein FPV67DRAFT_1758111 [Lyophyllum atratum]